MTADHPALRPVLAQTRAELLLTSRRGENILITVIVPVLLLVFFASLGIVRAGTGRPVDFLLPGMLALAVIATGMVSLGIATAYERYYGVLKRLGASPLSRGDLIAAKAISIVALEIVQVALLVAIAVLGYGWRLPSGHPGAVPTALLALLLGTLAFAGLGLAMAGGLRAETTLAGANGLYLAFLLLSGAVLPLDHLPAIVQDLAHVLPAAALTGALRAALAGGPFPATDLIVLAVWAVLALAVAMRTFRWE